MNQPTTYTLPEGLLQAIVSNLYGQPAAQSHELLNAIKAECTRQDQARAEAALAQQRQAIRDELKAELHKAVDDKVHAPAQPLPEVPAAA